MDTLCRHVDKSALCRSESRTLHSPRCLAGTRNQVKANLMAWINNADSPHFVLWFRGAAGAGKSAIAHTIADTCRRNGRLAAAFFCKHSITGTEDSTINIVASIAYQLILNVPATADFVYRAISNDPLIFSTPLEVQLKALVVDPLNQAATMPRSLKRLKKNPLVVIIDGLDEYRDAASQKDFLHALHAAFYTPDAGYRLVIPGVLRFLISSRPEQQIRAAFDSINQHTYVLPLDDRFNPKADIRLYLESEFHKIKTGHLYREEIPDDWPSQNDLEIIIDKSCGTFMYATTAIKYVESRHHHPMDQLQILLGRGQCDELEVPFGDLDDSYNKILTSTENWPLALEVLHFSLQVWACPTHHATWFSVFGYTWGDIQVALTDLHALIHVPSEPGAVRFLHTSFNEFLYDESRSRAFYIYCPTMCVRYGRRWANYLASNCYSDGVYLILSSSV